MTFFTSTSLRLASTLLISSVFFSACSSSSDNPPVSGSGDTSSDQVTDNNGNLVDDNPTDNAPSESSPDGETDNTTVDVDPVVTDPADTDTVTVTDPAVTDPAVTDPATTNPTIPDPLIQNSTRVKFDIQVPAYQSDALQVRLSWNDKDLAASWVGDEFWSISDDFPTNTEHMLVTTFSDNNGDITLGTVESKFKTGTNASESYEITADQFDTDRWDDDEDGSSNLDELIAGTYGSGSPSVLLFSETRDYRHPSIPDALGALEALASSAGIQTVQAGDSAGVFTDDTLARYDAVVWVLTSGDVLNAEEQAAFERYIRAGGGFAGIHAASDTEYDWPWYGALVGAYFERHPAIQTATQNVEINSHPSTAHLSTTWTRTDEWYDYQSNPRAQVNVLLSLDESTYSDGGMGEDHPSAWYHDYDGGRSWYTGGGHTKESYAEPDFRAHLLGGLRYAAGLSGL